LRTRKSFETFLQITTESNPMSNPDSEARIKALSEALGLMHESVDRLPVSKKTRITQAVLTEKEEGSYAWVTAHGERSGAVVAVFTTEELWESHIKQVAEGIKDPRYLAALAELNGRFRL